MSYVRMGSDGSDVYIYFDSHGYVLCTWCRLLPGDVPGFRTTNLQVMLGHIAEHRAAGHHVPDWVDGELRDDWPTEEEFATCQARALPGTS